MYTQYMFNTQTINPAYAGTWNSVGFMVLSRMQWVGIKGAPSTQTFSFQMPVNNEKMGIINKNELTNSKEIKDGIVSLSNGFSDKKFNVFYSKNKEKEFTIQESSWSSEISAKNRAEVLKSTGIFRNKEILVQPVIINNETVYRVNISNYDNIDEAREDVAKFKKPVQ